MMKPTGAGTFRKSGYQVGVDQRGGSLSGGLTREPYPYSDATILNNWLAFDLAAMISPWIVG